MILHLLSVLTNWLSLHWREVLALAGGGATLSIALETVLNKFHVNSKKLAYTLIHVLSIVTAVASYFLANLPTADVPAVYASVVILAQTWHRFVVSPAYNKFLVPYLNYLGNQKPVSKLASLPELTPAEISPESGFETTV